MGSVFQCFWIEPIARMRRSLRRFVFSGQAKCSLPKFGYHNIDVHLDDIDFPLRDPESQSDGGEFEFPADDPRWPKACACGYEFQPNDPRQANMDRIYMRSDNNELVTTHDPPVGAMWDAWWLGETFLGPDGIRLAVETPAGTWYPDNKHLTWQRTGSPRVPETFTVSPSILFHPSNASPGYHGWLRDGKLVEC